MHVSKKRVRGWIDSILNTLGRTVAAIIFFVIALFLYGLVGYGIGIPYSFLAGGLDHNMPGVAAFGPIILVVLVASGLIEYVMRAHDRNFKWYKVPVTWTLVAWATLPIWMYLISLATGALGYEKLSSILFEYRYHSMRLVLGGVIQLTIATVIFLIVLSWWQNKQKEYYERELKWIESSIRESEREIGNLTDIATKTARESVGHVDPMRTERQATRTRGIQEERERLANLHVQKHRLRSKLNLPVTDTQ